MNSCAKISYCIVLILLSTLTCFADESATQALGARVIPIPEGIGGAEASFHANAPAKANSGGGTADATIGVRNDKLTGHLGAWSVSGWAVGDPAFVHANGTQTVIGASPIFTFGAGAADGGARFGLWPKLAAFRDGRVSNSFEVSGGAQAGLVLDVIPRTNLSLLVQLLGVGLENRDGKKSDVGFGLLTADARFQLNRSLNLNMGLEISKLLGDTSALKVTSNGTDVSAPVVIGKVGAEIVF